MSLTLWMGLLTAFLWMALVSEHGIYPSRIFFPFFNFLCFLIFYKFFPRNIEKILKFLSYSVFGILIYCVLQALNLDQFYKSVAAYNPNDTIVGTIGNPTHLAGYLAICMPLFFGKGLFKRLGIYLGLGVILLTGSASGLLAALCVIGFGLYFKVLNPKDLIVPTLLGLAVFGFKYQFNFKTLLSNYAFPSGRIEVWKFFWENFKTPITGSGLGTFAIMTEKTEFWTWRHAHCEFIHLAKEIGLIGIGLIGWCVWDFFKRFKRTETNIILTAIFIGFLINCVFGYPAHLFLLASMAMMAYSSAYKGENNDGTTYFSGN